MLQDQVKLPRLSPFRSSLYAFVSSFPSLSMCADYFPLQCGFHLLKSFRSRNRQMILLEIRGFEPLTLGLQSRCSSQLSYIPVI